MEETKTTEVALPEMTTEQTEAYDAFIDCMVGLYNRFGHLLDATDITKTESVI